MAGLRASSQVPPPANDGTPLIVERDLNDNLNSDDRQTEEWIQGWSKVEPSQADIIDDDEAAL